ncbi:hypothetical protein MDA_GLEAN10013321 [Myotis davidii]|uniref:Uncharacterized protein n=1 Tax=Myotis davidii TaxID=225400 RepID=L5M1N6_MYODS|nr:hypothetical protein MDA_GLEAN10013321 [Myotis davidii]
MRISLRPRAFNDLLKQLSRKQVERSMINHTEPHPGAALVIVIPIMPSAADTELALFSRRRLPCSAWLLQLEPGTSRNEEGWVPETERFPTWTWDGGCSSNKLDMARKTLSVLSVGQAGILPQHLQKLYDHRQTEGGRLQGEPEAAMRNVLAEMPITEVPGSGAGAHSEGPGARRTHALGDVLNTGHSSLQAVSSHAPSKPWATPQQKL